MLHKGEDMENNQLADKILDSIQSMVDPTAPMEEQLVQMRAQLAALAQLPGVISQTLEMVTGQLGQLTEKKEVTECQVTTTEVKEEIVTESTTEVIHQEVTESVSEVTLERAAPGEEQETAAPQEEQETAAPRQEQETAAPREEPSLVDQRMNSGIQEQVLDEEMTIARNKKELMSELQLEHEQRQIKQRPTPRVAPAFGPLVPQERPLVLPGGRRWRNAKDAFNEDFIKETLTAQAEIISGKAKGINFLKWEKPVKTLDHLKDSSVYKLIHNMDNEPGKKVECLPPVVLAESEYREKSSRIRQILKESGLPIQAEPDCAKNCQNVCATKCKKICIAECPKICPEESPKLNKRVDECSKISAEETGQICVRESRQISGEQCVTVSATCGPKVCAEVCPQFTKCPQICGGVLPEICKINNEGTDTKQDNSGVKVQANMVIREINMGKDEQANLGKSKQAILGTNKKANLGTNKQDIPIATELVVPPAPARVELPPRPASRAEAVEIVTNYVETFSKKESRLTPACY